MSFYLLVSYVVEMFFSCAVQYGGTIHIGSQAVEIWLGQVRNYVFNST